MTTTIDRRKFLTYTGAAGAATGAAWVAPTVLGASTAFAAGSCERRDQINWGVYNTGDLAWPSQTGEFPIRPSRVQGPGTPEYDVTMTVEPVGTADAQSAAVDTGNAYGNVTGAYRMNMTGTSEGVKSEYGWNITFSWPSTEQAYRLSFSIVVVDQDAVSGGYKDYASVDPYRFNPSTSQYWISGSGTPGTNGSPWSGMPPGKDAFGNDVGGPAEPTSNAANVTLNDAFASGLSSVTVFFRGDSTYYGTPQSIGISNLTWCL